MNREITPLTDGKQTVRRMYSLSDRYAFDIDKFVHNGRPLSRLGMMDYYSFVRDIPFKRDREPVEWIARPELLLSTARAGLDCKKKSVLLGAYLNRRNFPKGRWRYAIVSRRPDGHPHHVLTQVNLAGHWYNFDATYKADRPFDTVPVTYFEPVRRGGE